MTHRSTYSGTVDSNGYPYCVNCGKPRADHINYGATRYGACPCEHYDVSRPTALRAFYRCNDCGQELYS
jgi:hypothetical protein